MTSYQLGAKTQARHLCTAAGTFLFCHSLQKQKLAQTKSLVNKDLNTMDKLFSVQTHKKKNQREREKRSMNSQNLNGYIGVPCK